MVPAWQSFVIFTLMVGLMVLGFFMRRKQTKELEEAGKPSHGVNFSDIAFYIVGGVIAIACLVSGIGALVG